MIADALHAQKFAQDDNAFFYEATRRLCCSLRPEASIASFYEYIAGRLPLSGFTLVSGKSSIEDVTIVASASPSRVICPFEKLITSPEQRTLGYKLGIADPSTFHNYLITSIRDAFFQYLTMFHYPGLSLPTFFLRLVREDELLGTAIFSGSATFNDHHLRLMQGLEGPLCIALSNMYQHRELQQIRETILSDNQRLRRELMGLSKVDVVGANHGLARVMQKVRQAAPVNVPVLITGETGVGKEVIARAVHDLSTRREKAFVAVNCGAIPPSLLDSELFGHARGAFTGAAEQHAGYFEQADGGTLFLDEIGELPLEAQTRLLRVLETGQVTRVGASAPIDVDLRLLAATNRNLPDMVREGGFRADLFFRLNVVSLHLPPLRERREDIPRLVQFLLQRSAARFGVLAPVPDVEEMERLLAYDWPGNVRELQNRLEEALVCCENGVLRCRLPSFPPEQVNIVPARQAKDAPLQTYDEHSRDYFLRLLRLTGGRIAGERGAARLAGLNSNTFRFKCQKLGVDWHGKL